MENHSKQIQQAIRFENSWVFRPEVLTRSRNNQTILLQRLIFKWTMYCTPGYECGKVDADNEQIVQHRQ